jgi:hypothetical protein
MAGRTVRLQTMLMYHECVQFLDHWFRIEVLCCNDLSVKAD